MFTSCFRPPADMADEQPVRGRGHADGRARENPDTRAPVIAGASKWNDGIGACPARCPSASESDTIFDDLKSRSCLGAAPPVAPGESSRARRSRWSSSARLSRGTSAEVTRLNDAKIKKPARAGADAFVIRQRRNNAWHACIRDGTRTRPLLCSLLVSSSPPASSFDRRIRRGRPPRPASTPATARC